MAHQEWLDAHLEQLFVAAVGLKKGIKPMDDAVVAKVLKYLNRAVAAAKEFLPEFVPSLGELPEVTGADDSDSDVNVGSDGALPAAPLVSTQRGRGRGSAIAKKIGRGE